MQLPFTAMAPMRTASCDYDCTYLLLFSCFQFRMASFLDLSLAHFFHAFNLLLIFPPKSFTYFSFACSVALLHGMLSLQQLNFAQRFRKCLNTCASALSLL